MRVISVISTKGGEGKSTHSANLAGICADAGLKHCLLMRITHSQLLLVITHYFMKRLVVSMNY